MVADPKCGSSWGGWCFNEPLGVFGGRILGRIVGVFKSYQI